MEDKLHNFFSENEFNFQEPRAGHMERFEKRLQKGSQKTTSWKWMSVAASIILLLGFTLGSSVNNSDEKTLGSVSAKMQEVETFYVNTINLELKEVEKSRSLGTENIIENALERLEELEDSYKAFVEEITKNGNQVKIISEMINNYQKRLEILQNTLDQIEQVKNPKILDDEIIS